MLWEPAKQARAIAWEKVFGWGLADGGAVRAAWASLAEDALERRFTYKQSLSAHNLSPFTIFDCPWSHLVADALAQVLEALPDVRRVVIGLIGVLARRSQ